MNYLLLLDTLIVLPIYLAELLILALVLMRLYTWLRHRFWRGKSISFFHPHSNGGGGGERVLWIAVQSLLRSHSDDLTVFIYSKPVEKAGLLRHVKERFNLDLEAKADKIVLVPLSSYKLLEPSNYPVLTMLLQSLASMLVALECVLRSPPQVYLDTTGYSFTLPVVKLLTRARTAAYIHYPTISTSMIQRVQEKRPSYNNRSSVAGSDSITSAKLMYYFAFAFLYGLSGWWCDVVLTNSSWTEGHILKLWHLYDAPLPSNLDGEEKKEEEKKEEEEDEGEEEGRFFKVYPPCDTRTFLRIHPEEDEEDEDEEDDEEDEVHIFPRRNPLKVISISQFRPEKDHCLQVEAFSLLIDALKAKGGLAGGRMPLLVMVGSVRNEGDQRVLDEVKALVQEKVLEKYIKFDLNVSFSALLDHFASASVGLHTMWNEHFGIGVVEMMAAGLVVVAHDSGGPQMDIVVSEELGFRASEPRDYALCLMEALQLSEEKRGEMVRKARAHSKKFSDQAFEKRFEKIISVLL